VFVKRAIAGSRRVLEVGAGRGVLARRLHRDGFAVTAVDLKLPAKEDRSYVRWVETDFLKFEDEPFDAIAFTTSLHHISPLDGALDKAKELLAPGGVLVLDEFDVEAPDEETARWYYDVQELLAVAGAYDRSRLSEVRGRTALDRWRAEHEHDDERLHPGRAMLARIEKTFARVEVMRSPYLHRYICAGTSNLNVARHVKMVEERGIAEARLRAVGLRVVARQR
jgi:SAM-dependent methyltransferase